jgi:Acetyltransferase (GNAT) domain
VNPVRGVIDRVVRRGGGGAGAEAGATTGADPGDLVLSLLPPEEALASPAVRPGWEALLGDVHPLNRLYASPVWFEHVWRTYSDVELYLGTLRDRTGQVLGACPFSVRDIALSYDVASRALVRTNLRAAIILGGEPMLPPSPGAYRRLLDGLFAQLGPLDCGHIFSLPLEGHFGRFLRGHGRASRAYFSYLPGRPRPWYWIEMGSRFDDYLGTMGGKARYNIRRQVRELRKHGAGALELMQVDSEGQVGEFLELATRVSLRSWQHRVLGQRIGQTDRHHLMFNDLARRGILRCFLLKCGPQPCAFAVGYQHEGVYQYVEIGYDDAVGHLSPGTSLLYLILEELHRDRTPSSFNFGIGDAAYKQRFANRQSRDASVFLFRRNLANHLRYASHRTLDLGVGLAKRLLSRRRVDRGPAPGATRRAEDRLEHPEPEASRGR